MQYERITTGELPVSILTAAEFLRIDVSDPDLEGVTRTAADEVEAYCELALTDQTITATTENRPSSIIYLPVGPLADEPNGVVELIELDGTTTPIASGFWFEAGRYPRLHFTEGQPGGRIRVTYDAGFGPDDGAVPASLQHAVLDHASRLYDARGFAHHQNDAAQLSPAARRICARFRRVRL